MADNFNMKQFLMENKLGAYSKLKETEEGYMGTQYGSSEDMAVDMVKKGITEKDKEEKLKEGEDIFTDIDDDLAYGSDSKEDAIEYLQDIINYCQKKMIELENEKGFEEEDEAFGGINEMDNEDLVEKDKTEEAVSQVILPKDVAAALGSDNPEVDQLVVRFLQGIAKKFNYPMAKAAIFVKERIKKLGY